MISAGESAVNNLKNKCHISTGNDGDRFVGIKFETGNIGIWFPIGYHLSDKENILREDILNLFRVLHDFNKQDSSFDKGSFDALKSSPFPIYSYLKIIKKFLSDGRYYIESDPEYRVGATGQISWARTIRNQVGFVKNGNLIFTKAVARHLNPNANKLITQIHKFCVYEAFDKLGWLYIANKPEFPGQHPSIKESIQILTKKISESHNDNEQELFGAMLNMLKYLDEQNSEKNYLFGTDYFERVWEGMIDRAFGIIDKRKFFPKTRWLLDYDNDKEKFPLLPDSIMIYKNKFYVLDAKYYRYGVSGNSDHLPNSTDINKQITYGEYIAKNFQIPNDELFNAFVLPYDMNSNSFEISSEFNKIGEAIGDWKENANNYERIQGIVVDTRFLLYNYLTISDRHKQQFAKIIEQKK